MFLLKTTTCLDLTGGIQLETMLLNCYIIIYNYLTEMWILEYSNIKN
jgi:hypothetical protein